jgi:hypothetical protein
MPAPGVSTQTLAAALVGGGAIVAGTCGAAGA